MDFNLDEVIDRRGTNCVKWEFIDEGDKRIFSNRADPRHGPKQLLPLWVADMDFRSPPAVVKALAERAEQGIFGYSHPCDSYYEAVIGWMARRYGREIERDWIVITPGVMPAVDMLIQAFVPPGEKVLIQPPVYHPFFEAIKDNDRRIASNPLKLKDGRYTMDFDDLARKTADPEVKMALLCSPHNPVGRVWSKDELTRFGRICQDNDVLVVSDEVHCDLIYSDHTFISYATISETFAQSSVVCTAGSKTFNLAGLKHSNIIIPDPGLRSKFEKVAKRNGLKGANAFGIVALEAAYNHGEAWLADVMAYVEENYRFMVDYLAEHLPQLRVIRPEGTYLVWVDCRRLGLDPAERKELFMNKANVYLDEGEMFGIEGEGFERFNIACPRSILAEALARIKEVINTCESCP